MAPASDAPVLEIRGLHFNWPDVPLFKNLNMLIPAGVSMVCGEESSGKTTLLCLLSGDLQADQGAFVWHHAGTGASLPDTNMPVFRTEPRSNRLDAVSARAWLSSLSARYPGFDARLALGLANGFALEAHIDKPMYMLSAGSKRKVWLCAAFAAGTALTLIDEPFAALDLAAVRFLKELLLEASQHPNRVWLLADHAPSEGIALRSVQVLGD